MPSWQDEHSANAVETHSLRRCWLLVRRARLAGVRVSHRVPSGFGVSGCGPCICKAANEKVENADALVAN